MGLTRNQYLFIIIVFVILFKIICVEIFYKKGFMPVTGTYVPVSHTEDLERDILLAELKFLEKQIEADLLLKRLQKIIGEEALKKILEDIKLNSILSDEGGEKLYQVFLEDEETEEEGLLRFFAFLKQNQALFFQSHRKVSQLVIEDGSLPFLNTLKRQFYIYSKEKVVGGSAPGSGSFRMSTIEQRGVYPITQTSGFFVSFVQEIVKIIFDITKVIFINKEIFLIFSIVMAMIIGLVVVYSMHFR